MSNWSNIDTIYLYDGTINGLFTIINHCIEEKIIPKNIIDENNYLSNFLEKTKYINTNQTIGENFFGIIEDNISHDVLHDIYYSFLSNGNDKEINILKYLVKGFIVGPEINKMLHLDYVRNVQSYRKNMLFEVHRFTGLLRFMDVGNNLYYSKIHPDNNIIEKLGHHFIRRLPTQNFIIHDPSRQLAFLYNSKIKNTYEIIDIKQTDFKIPEISQEEKKYQDLWKMFFKTIAIKERTNPRCQMNYMPKKYWKDLIEVP